MDKRVERLCVVRVYYSFQVSLSTVDILYMCVDIECVEILCAKCVERRQLCRRDVGRCLPELDLFFHYVSPDFVVFVHKLDDLADFRFFLFLFRMVGL